MSNPEGYYILDTRDLRKDNLATWWRPNSKGYTFHLDAAGIYTKAEADAICGPSRGEHVAVPVEQARAMTMTVVDASKALAFAKKEGSNVT